MNQQNIWELKGSQLIKQIKRAEVIKRMLKHSKARLILDVDLGINSSVIAGQNDNGN